MNWWFESELVSSEYLISTLEIWLSLPYMNWWFESELVSSELVAIIFSTYAILKNAVIPNNTIVPVV